LLQGSTAFNFAAIYNRLGKKAGVTFELEFMLPLEFERPNNTRRGAAYRNAVGEALKNVTNCFGKYWKVEIEQIDRPQIVLPSKNPNLGNRHADILLTNRKNLKEQIQIETKRTMKDTAYIRRSQLEKDKDLANGVKTIYVKSGKI
jgi:hypothetical protein